MLSFTPVLCLLFNVPFRQNNKYTAILTFKFFEPVEVGTAYSLRKPKSREAYKDRDHIKLNSLPVVIKMGRGVLDLRISNSPHTEATFHKFIKFKNYSSFQVTLRYITNKQ
jgi:hypothetical protein